MQIFSDRWKSLKDRCNSWKHFAFSGAVKSKELPFEISKMKSFIKSFPTDRISNHQLWTKINLNIVNILNVADLDGINFGLAEIFTASHAG